MAAERPTRPETSPDVLDALDALPTLVELLDRPPAWQTWTPLAACRGMTDALFYPEPGQGRTDTARDTCRACPVRWECLADALGWEPSYHRFGVWGGLDGAQRIRVARALKAHREAVAEADGAAS